MATRRSRNVVITMCACFLIGAITGIASLEAFRALILSPLLQISRPMVAWSAESGEPVPSEFRYATFLQETGLATGADESLYGRVIVNTHAELFGSSDSVEVFDDHGVANDIPAGQFGFACPYDQLGPAIRSYEETLRVWGHETDIAALRMSLAAESDRVVVELKIVAKDHSWDLYEYEVSNGELRPRKLTSAR